MTDNVAAMAGDKGEPGHGAESTQTGDSAATVNPVLPADSAASKGGAAANESGEDSAAADSSAAEDDRTSAPSEADPALPQVPYGAWPSPITAAQVAGGRNRVSYPTIIGGTTWWQED